MTSIARWSFRHRRIVLGLWIALLVGLGVVNGAVGAAFKDDFKLPDTESKRALDILQRDFPAASGESGQIVVHARSGTLPDQPVAAEVTAMLQRVRAVPHVVNVQGYDGPRGSQQITPDSTTAY